MSAPTFKADDRVRCWQVSGMLKITGVSASGNVACVVDSNGEEWRLHTRELTHVAPMSPQARMLWHAMRAGAKRTNGRVFVQGLRKRTYWNDDGVILTIYGDYRAEVQS